jgi:hypothetical protein
MRTLRLFIGLFAVVGLIFVSAGIGIFLHTRRFVATAVSVSGMVTENIWRLSPSSRRDTSSSVFYPRIRFRTDDGQDITTITNTGSYPPAHHINEAVTILYDPQQPYHAVIRSFAELWMLPLVFSGLGLLFLSIGAGPIVWKGLRIRKIAWLRENGRRITADITHVGLNTSLTVNGEHPYRILCQWLDPAVNQMHTFKSESIWFNPGQYIHGKTVEVLVDPTNPHRYLVVTDFLPRVV